MKYFLGVSLIVLVFIFSCNTKTSQQLTPFSLLNTDSLVKEVFSIDITKDTLLKTTNGAWLKIAKGTFSIDSGATVDIEIREAYSINQMIKAGLVTQSNGEPLSSGGMIYVNAVGGKKVNINKPIKVAIPTDFVDKKMNVYKGVADSSGNINWVNPVPLAQSKQLTTLEKGEIYFQQKCASCHGIGKDGSGPDLANIKMRDALWTEGSRQYALMHRFYNLLGASDSARPILSMEESKERRDYLLQERYDYEHFIEDIYGCNLIKQYNNKAIDLSADFEKNQDEWMNVYDFIQNESNKRNLPFPKHAYLDKSVDSCHLYETLKDELEEKKIAAENKRQKLIEDNGPMAKHEMNNTPSGTSTEGFTTLPPADFDDKVTPGYYDAQYYQFTIETFGWHNVDALLNEINDVAESELLVNLTGEYKDRVQMFLIIPSKKVFGEGGPTERKDDEYAFFKKTGKTPLPQNAKAYILAVHESDGIIAYSLKEFTTGRQQTIDIELKKSTKQEFNAAMESIDADKLSISVAKSKHAEAIKKADKKIEELEQELKKAEKLKPTLCDCDCGMLLPVKAPEASVK